MNQKKTNTKPKVALDLPRSPEEMFAKVKKAGKENAQGLMDKAIKDNKSIAQAREIAETLKSPGWKYFWNHLREYSEVMDNMTVRNIQGDILAKGAIVERIQGKLEVMEHIDDTHEYFMKLAGREMVDTKQLKATIDEL